MADKVILTCSECLSRNYVTTKNKKTNTQRLEVKKYCPKCGKHTLHKETFLVDRLCEDIDILKHYFDVFIITDGRLVSEFNLLKERFPEIKIIHVIRENYDNKLTLKEKEHITETDMESYKDYDYVVRNTTKEELYREADKIMDIESGVEYL